MNAGEILWPRMPDRLHLNGEVLVLCALLDLPRGRIEQLANLLSADEKVKAGRFHLERDRDRFIAGRGQLREILGRLLGVEGKRLTFSYGTQGKPRLTGPAAGLSLRFNLAHSGSLVVYAIDRTHELGVDVEQVRPVREAGEIASRHFSAREFTTWRGTEPDRQTEVFFNIWTRKEAWLKAHGRGLSETMSQIETGPSLAEADHRSRKNVHWSWHTLAPAAAYVGALATSHPTTGVRCWTWL